MLGPRIGEYMRIIIIIIYVIAMLGPKAGEDMRIIIMDIISILKTIQWKCEQLQPRK